MGGDGDGDGEGPDAAGEEAHTHAGDATTRQRDSLIVLMFPYPDTAHWPEGATK